MSHQPNPTNIRPTKRPLSLWQRFKARLHSLQTNWHLAAWQDLAEAMEKNPDYAHSVQCNIACTIYDNANGRLSMVHSNIIADVMMRHFWDIDMHRVRAVLQIDFSQKEEPAPVDNLRSYMDNPEACAALFHANYEALAPRYQYETREASAKPWDQVPEQNRDLMIATAAETLRDMARHPAPKIWHP